MPEYEENNFLGILYHFMIAQVGSAAAIISWGSGDDRLRSLHRHPQDASVWGRRPFLGSMRLFSALSSSFTLLEAASVAIIGGADGPDLHFLTSKLAPHSWRHAVAAYSYMAMCRSSSLRS